MLKTSMCRFQRKDWIGFSIKSMASLLAQSTTDTLAAGTTIGKDAIDIASTKIASGKKDGPTHIFGVEDATAAVADQKQ